MIDVSKFFLIPELLFCGRKFSHMTFNASKYVEYLEDWQVLICLHEDCGYCLKPNGVGRHFSRHHRGIYELHTRQQIGRHAATLRLCQPSDIVVPRNTPPLISGLKVWKDGWQCKECFKVGYMVGGARQHSERIHGWKSGQGKQR